MFSGRLPPLLLGLFLLVDGLGQLVGEEGRDSEEGRKAQQDVVQESPGVLGRPDHEAVEHALPGAEKNEMIT